MKVRYYKFKYGGGYAVNYKPFGYWFEYKITIRFLIK